MKKIIGPCIVEFGGQVFTATDVRIEMDLAPTPEPGKLMVVFPTYFCLGCNQRGETENAFPE
jgi:hypothetical protein